MKLITKLSPTKNQIDQVSRFEYNNGEITVYFSRALEINGEILDEVFDVSNSITLNTTKPKIIEILNSLFEEALDTRSKQLSQLEPLIEVEPNYKSFYQELITTQLFFIARMSAGEELQCNIAYSDFALALTNSIVGNDNPIALQLCLDNMLNALGNKVTKEMKLILKQLVAKYQIPLVTE